MEHPLAEAPLPFGTIVNCGLADYREFACSRATFQWLEAGAMASVDGVPVRLQVMGELVGGHNLLVKAWPLKEDNG